MRTALALLLAAAASLPAVAQNRGFLDVQELYVFVETPRLAQEVCATSQPQTAPQYAKMFAAWRERHAGVLKQVETLVDTTDRNLRRGGSPSRVATSVDTARQRLRQRVSTSSPADVKKFCDAYPDLIKATDEQMKQRVPDQIKALSKPFGSK
jgi:hypothetical protein